MSKIKRLEIENFLGIKELDINLGDVNKVTGGNGKGKTSILDSIQKALFNSMDPRPQIVRTGEEVAHLFVELDNGVSIERKIKADGKSSVVVVDNGDKVKSPESYLKQLLGKHVFGFNPVSFMGESDKAQTDILLGVLPIEVKAEDVKEWLKDELYPEGYEPLGVTYAVHGLQVCKQLANKQGGILYDKRALLNKEVALYEDEIISINNTLPDNYKLEDWEGVSLREIQDKINKANQVNNFISEANHLVENADLKTENIRNSYNLKKNEKFENASMESSKAERELAVNIELIDEQIKSFKKRIENLEAEKGQAEITTQNLIQNINKFAAKEMESLNESAEKEIIAIQTRVKNANDYLKENKKVDIEPLNKQFDDTEKMRSYIPLAQKVISLSETFESKKKEAECFDKFVEVARNKPKELLAGIKLPIEGMGIGDDGIITIDDLPIKNKSTGEQLKIALDIARVTAGDLKLICVDRLESLDADVKEELFEQIENDGYQYILTDVTKGEMEVQVK